MEYNYAQIILVMTMSLELWHCLAQYSEAMHVTNFLFHLLTTTWTWVLRWWFLLLHLGLSTVSIT